MWLVKRATSVFNSLVPRRSLLIRCPRELDEYLSVTSQLMVESRNDRAENAWGLGWLFNSFCKNFARQVARFLLPKHGNGKQRQPICAPQRVRPPLNCSPSLGTNQKLRMPHLSQVSSITSV